MYIGYNIFIKSYLFNLGLYFLMNSASFIILCCPINTTEQHRIIKEAEFIKKYKPKLNK